MSQGKRPPDGRNDVRQRTTCEALNRRLSVARLNARLNHPTTVLLSGRPWRPSNLLGEACRILRNYVQSAERSRRRNPHLYRSPVEFHGLEQWQFERDLEQAIRRVYGSPDPDDTTVDGGANQT